MQREILKYLYYIKTSIESIDDVIIWGIISKDIPNLKIQVEKLNTI
ncbi:MAG: hypothetical protein JXR53_01990 [Bacteroidales bacterium]|nr:hypothetical protein [Bacteroidales bacterium]